MKKLLKEPLLHFLLLGVALFAMASWRGKQHPVEGTAPRIEITSAVIERLRAGYERQFGHAPGEDELREIVTAHIREEILYREALVMGLDRDDTIVRRRMAQKLEFLTHDIVSAAEPADAELQQFFTENAARYAKPERVSFRHIYFSREKRGAGSGAAAHEALAALSNGARDDTLGDPFLQGYEFAQQERSDVSALFGNEFFTQLGSPREGEWTGPVESSYGLHLVRIAAREGTRPATFADVREAVRRDFDEDRRGTVNRGTFEKLRERYQVTVDEAALGKAAAPAAITARR